jgi:hypothetical protein
MRNILDTGHYSIEDDMEIKTIMGKRPLVKHLQGIPHTFMQQRSKPK